MSDLMREKKFEELVDAMNAELQRDEAYVPGMYIHFTPDRSGYDLSAPTLNEADRSSLLSRVKHRAMAKVLSPNPANDKGQNPAK